MNPLRTSAFTYTNGEESGFQGQNSVCRFLYRSITSAASYERWGKDNHRFRGAEPCTGSGRVTRGLFGIPAQAFTAVLVTIVQRYLAPLVLLNLQLTPREATIAISMIALSLPCLPVVVITWREMGGRALTRILAMGLAVSFSVGVVLNLLLPV